MTTSLGGMTKLLLTRWCALLAQGDQQQQRRSAAAAAVAVHRSLPVALQLRPPVIPILWRGAVPAAADMAIGACCTRPALAAPQPPSAAPLLLLRRRSGCHLPRIFSHTDIYRIFSGGGPIAGAPRDLAQSALNKKRWNLELVPSQRRGVAPRREQVEIGRRVRRRRLQRVVRNTNNDKSRKQPPSPPQSAARGRGGAARRRTTA